MSTFWDAKYWLPRDVDWDQIPARFEDLIYPIYFAIPILIFRVLLEAYVGFGVGYVIGAIPGDQLSTRIRNHIMGGFARYSRSKRVLECMFRFIAYSLLFSYGLFVLWDKSWLRDVTQCWIGYPFHKIDTAIW